MFESYTLLCSSCVSDNYLLPPRKNNCGPDVKRYTLKMLSKLEIAFSCKYYQNCCPKSTCIHWYPLPSVENSEPIYLGIHEISLINPTFNLGLQDMNFLTSLWLPLQDANQYMPCLVTFFSFKNHLTFN